MQFSDVVGQENIKVQLMQMHEQNRVSHAQLFLAKEGTGGLPMALAFAQYMVCEKVNKLLKNEPAELFRETVFEEIQGSSLDSCEVCSACKKAAQMVHPDIHYSYPIFPKKPGDKTVCTDFIKEWREFVAAQPYGNNYDWLQHAGAENKQGNINVHECQDISRKMSLKSFESVYKILIMWMPEYLGNEGNKLLKLVEEPPPNTLFIFVAENDERILQTILSRTQLVKFPPLSPKAIAESLVKKEDAEIKNATQIAGIAEGNYHEALQLLQHTDENFEEMLRTWLNVVVAGNLPRQVKWIETISKTGREKQKQFLKYFSHLLQQSVRLQVIDEERTAQNDFAFRLNMICSLEKQEAIMQELDLAAFYIERNANAKMLFHALTIKLHHIIKNNAMVVVS